MLFNYWFSLLLFTLPTLKVEIETWGEQRGFAHSLSVFSVVTFWPVVAAQVRRGRGRKDLFPDAPGYTVVYIRTTIGNTFFLFLFFVLFL